MTRTVLVVDDAPLARATIAAVLGRAGYDVRTATSISEACAELDRAVPDCVIVDRRLPDGDGLAFVSKMRAQDSTRGVRVVVLSGDPLLPGEGADADVVLLKSAAGARSVLDAVADSDST